ncbi:MAG TPA: adenylate/guanylate cyclase domain-containing protein [Flavobacteriales bacterium]|nr:tetratricopeptide repeat protein [Flavobacteriales bacterium]HQW86112.1 adenylate/guanylate cyclase domain-containing protein [Flavobacteriales bacterium]
MRLFLSLTLCLLAAAARPQSDSLWSVWRNEALPDSARLTAMASLSWKAVFEKPDSGLTLARMQLELARTTGDPKALYTAYNTLAVGHKMRSDLPAALDHFNRALEVARSMTDRGRTAATLSNMSTVYKDLGDLPRALELLHQSLRIDQELGNTEGVASTYNNIGNTYKRLNEFGKALENYERSAALYNELGNAKGRASALVSIGTTHSDLGERGKAATELQEAIGLYRGLGNRLDRGKAHNNLGQVLSRLDRPREAHAHFDTARAVFTELDAKDPLTRNLYYTGEAYLAEGRAADALKVCRRGLVLADSLGLLAQRKECTECVMRALALVGDYRGAYEAQRSYLSLDDTLDKVNNGKEVLRLELVRDFEQQQIADSLSRVKEAYAQQLAFDRRMADERGRRGMLIAGIMLALVIAGALLSRLRYTQRAKKAIEHEKERSDELLHNILPVEVAAELKAKGRAEARSYDTATVLFTDFKGFTQLSEQLSAAELVEEIDACFKGLDAIVERHRVEKIKTIGDAYMAAAGLPDPQASSAADIVLAALDMRDHIAQRRTERLRAGKPAFEMRIGLHSGPVIAGIVGVRKFAYDIWGDTVNTAARMESSGEAGRVNISATTYELVKDTPGLRFEPRGLVHAKGKGDLRMYFVERA